MRDCSACGQAVPDDALRCHRCGATRGGTPVDNAGRPASAALPPVPEKVSHYVILERIGEGAASFVYKARDPALQRTVAVKILHPTTHRNTIQRFLREARVMAGLSHPNVVAVHQVGSQDGQHYLIMEYIAGKTFEHHLDAGTMPFLERLQVMGQVCQGIAYAHRNRIIHRDLKPSNIMIEDSGRAVVTDFGLARAIETGTKVTRTGTVMGTPGYMSPEQVKGLEADPSSDVFSLGAILYEAVTGRLAFTGKTEAEIYDRILNAEPEPPRTLNPSIHPDLETIVLHALEKDSLRRYESAVDLSDDMTRFLAHEPIRARKASFVHRTVRFLRKRKLVLIPLLAGGLVAAILGSLWLYQRAAERQEVDLQVSELLRLGEAQMAGNPGAAEEFFVKAQALDPGRREAAESIERARQERRRRDERVRGQLIQADEGIAKFDLAHFLPPHDLREDVARTLAPALALADEALHSGQLEFEAKFVRGRILWRLGRFEEAETALRQSIQPGRESAVAMELGQMHLQELDQKQMEEFYAQDAERTVRREDALARKAVDAFQEAIAHGGLEAHEMDYASARLELLKERPAGALAIARRLIEKTKDKGPRIHARALGVLVQVYFQERRYAECLEAMRELKELQRSHPLVYLRSAQALFHVAARRLHTTGDTEPMIEQGLADLKTAQTIDPGNGMAHNMAGILLWLRACSPASRGRSPAAVLDEAESRLREALKSRPDYRVARVNLGSVGIERVRLAFEAGRDPSDACHAIIREMTAVLEPDPLFYLPYVVRAAAHEHLGRQRDRGGKDPSADYARSREDLDRAEKLSASPAVWINRAVVRLAQAEFEQAHGRDPEELLRNVDEDCGRVLRADPDFPPALIDRGVASMIRAERALQSGRDPASDDEKAIGDFSRALEKKPGDVQARSNRATCHGMNASYLIRQGRDPGAELGASIADYQDVLRIAPSFYPAHANLGLAYLHRAQNSAENRIEDLDRGIEHARRAIELSPSEAALYVNLVSLHLVRARLAPAGAREDLEAAERAACEGVRLNGSYFQIYYSRAEVYRDRAALSEPGSDERKKFADRALQDVDRCLDLHAGFAQAYLARGQIHLSFTGRYGEAVASFEKAIQLNPQTRRTIEPMLKEARARLAKDPEY